MTATPSINSQEEPQLFLGILQEYLQAVNEKRTTYTEQIYQDIPNEKKAILLMSTLRNTTISRPIRSFAAVMFQRLFKTQFENFWPKYSPDQQMSLKKELLACITQIDDDESIRKNVCSIAAVLARNLMNENEQKFQWPEIIEFLFQSANSTHTALKESALIILEAFPGIFGGSQTEQLTQRIHQIFLNCLNDQDTKVRYTAVTALAAYLKHNCENLQLVNIYRDCLPCLILTITHSLTNSVDNTVLKALVNIAENTPKYLRPAIDEVFNLCLYTIQQKDEFEKSRRHLALEVLVILSEKASTMVKKIVKKYMNRLVPQLLEMMVDLDDDAEWSTKDIIEIEEDDSNAFVGSRSLDRLACTLGGKIMLNYILTTVQTMLQNCDWRYRYAGLMAISVIGEGCNKEMLILLDDLVNSILVFLKDSHPRVRYAACNTLGLMSTDFKEIFQKKFHSKVVPGLLSILDDNDNPRTQTHGGAALVNFAEGCPSHILVEHLPQIIDKLEQVFNRKYQEFVQNNRKLVLEQMITTLAATADGVGQEFSPYYNRFMSQLKYLFKNRILRGRTIECITLIGLAVGKEKFVNDCYEVIQELVKIEIDFNNFGNNDLQISYLSTAWARICKILEKDCEQYLPTVVRLFLKVARFKPEITTFIDVEEKDKKNWQIFYVDNQVFGIKKAGLEEKATACSMLIYFAKELKENFVNYIEETTELIVPFLGFYCDTVIRKTAVECLPHLLDCGKLLGNDYVQQMWKYINKELFKAIQIEPDQQILGELFSSLGKCIEILGVSSLTHDQLEELTLIIENYLKKQLRDEEEDDDDVFILSLLANIIHSLLVTYTDSYLIYFDRLIPHFYTLIQQTRSISDRQWTICIFDDVIQFTGAHSYRYAQFFLSHMAESLADPTPEIRQCSAYGFGIMGMYGGPVYANVCAEILPRLCALINTPDSRTVENNVATENAISAVTKIFKYNNSYVENIDKLHQIWFSWLPIYEDTQEIPYVYDYLCDLIELNNLVIIGKNNSNILNVIHLLDDAFTKSSIEIHSVVGQRIVLILQHLQTISSISQT